MRIQQELSSLPDQALQIYTFQLWQGAQGSSYTSIRILLSCLWQKQPPEWRQGSCLAKLPFNSSLALKTKSLVPTRNNMKHEPILMAVDYSLTPEWTQPQPINSLSLVTGCSTPGACKPKSISRSSDCLRLEKVLKGRLWKVCRKIYNWCRKLQPGQSPESLLWGTRLQQLKPVLIRVQELVIALNWRDWWWLFSNKPYSNSSLTHKRLAGKAHP